MAENERAIAPTSSVRLPLAVLKLLHSEKISVKRSYHVSESRLRMPDMRSPLSL